MGLWLVAPVSLGFAVAVVEFGAWNILRIVGPCVAFFGPVSFFYALDIHGKALRTWIAEGQKATGSGEVSISE